MESDSYGEMPQSDKLDGEINMDLSGKIEIKEKESGIEGAGTYVLRNGKLVPGKAERREQASFSNWYCSNADPEDIRRHRELMDRFTYRGPQWDGVGIPKSILEEKNPVYKKVDGEDHPMVADPDSEGYKEFEHVVR